MSAGSPPSAAAVSFLPPLRPSMTAASTSPHADKKMNRPPHHDSEHEGGGNERNGQPAPRSKACNRSYFDKSRLAFRPPPSTTHAARGRGRGGGRVRAISSVQPRTAPTAVMPPDHPPTELAQQQASSVSSWTTATCPANSTLTRAQASAQLVMPPTAKAAASVSSSSSVVGALWSPQQTVPRVKEWAQSAQLERESGLRNADLARALFRQVVLMNPKHARSAEAAAAAFAAKGGVQDSEEDTAVDQLTMLATRVAVSALLLQETVLALPRHQQMLQPYVRMLLQAVYVPDDAEHTNLAEGLSGATLDFPAVLDGLQVLSAMQQVGPASTPKSSETNNESRGADPLSISVGPSSTGATVATAPAMGVAAPFLPPHQQPRTSVFEDDYLAALLASGGRGPSPEYLAHLLAPFARKPFFVALLELSQRVTSMAHTVRSQKLHMQKLPMIFAMTHVSWTKTLLRTAMRAWWKLCVERRARVHRHRARWAQRWSTERVRLGIRYWRGVAAYTLQTAEADSAAKAAITERKEVIHRLLTDVEGLQKTHRTLSVSLHVKEQERRSMEATLLEMEQPYQALLNKVRMMDRLGSALLDSLLLPLSESSSEVLLGERDAVEPAPDNVPPGQKEETVPDRHEVDRTSPEPPSWGLGQQGGAAVSCASPPSWQEHYVSSLRVLVEWADQKVRTDGKDTEELCAMSPRTAERHMGERTDSGSPSPLERRSLASGEDDQDQELDHTQERATHDTLRNNSNRSSSSSSTEAAAPVVVEPVFTQLLPGVAATSFGAAASAGTAEDDATGAAMGALNHRDGGSGGSHAGTFVPIPLYKYLVLMRCFKQVVLSAPPAHREQSPRGLSQRAPPLQLNGSARKTNRAEVHPKAPALDTVRMVKTADAAILASLRSLHQLVATRAHEGGGGGGGPLGYQGHGPRVNGNGAGHTNSGGGSELVDGGGGGDLDSEHLIALLPGDMRAAAEDVAKILVDSYERLTGTACVVTAQQLLHRGRGAQLVFLAALFRHYTNWSVRCAQVDEAGGSESRGAALDALTTTAPCGPHLGRRHAKYSDWYLPPAAHLHWVSRVMNQQRWIALSFSALHRALYENARPRLALSLEEQDLAITFVRSLSLSRLADVLPTSPDLTTRLYIGVVQTMERSFSRLRHVFHLYAVPAREIKAVRKARLAATASASSSSTASMSSPLSTAASNARKKAGNDATRAGSSGDSNSSGGDESNDSFSDDDDDDDDDGEQTKKRSHNGSSSRPEETRRFYITANGFWHLLCDAGVAGDGGGAGGATERDTEAAGAANTPNAVTLHRAAVFSIIEHVVFRTLDQVNDVDRTANATTTTTTTSPGKHARRPLQVGCTKLSPHFARAVHGGRHVDLRRDRATLCLNAFQFSEAMVRCAHYWQAMQSGTARNDANGASKAGSHVASGLHPGETGDSTQTSSFRRKSHNSIAAGSSTVFAGPMLKSQRVSLISGAAVSSPSPSDPLGSTEVSAGRMMESAAKASTGRVPQAAAAATVAAPHVFVHYEGPVDDCPPLNPQLLEVFLEDWVLPHCLAGPGGSAQARHGNGGSRATQLSASGGGGGGSAPGALTAFRRAIRQADVQFLLAAYQDELFGIFERFSKPREAFGIRSALPPPFSYSCLRTMPADESANPTMTTMGSPRKLQLRREPSGMMGSMLLRAGSRRGSAARPGISRLLSSRNLGGGGGSSGEVPATPGKQQVRDVGIVAVMSFTEVEAMAKALRWKQVSTEALRHCFTHVIIDRAREGSTLFFTEFLDLLCALAGYVEVSPMVPLATKLERFLKSHVLTDLGLASP